MNAVEQIYEGDDLVVPRRVMEKLGVKPGDTVIVQSRPTLTPTSFSAAEQEKRAVILQKMAAAWQDSDLSDFEAERKKLWGTWKTFNL